MGYEIKTLRAHSGNYSQAKNAQKYIVIHNTGNSASAKAEATYAHNNRHSSSYHYVLDGKDIYKTVYLKHTAWAVGCANWKGAKALVKNNESISIEVCSDGKEFTTAEKKQLRWLVKRLMKKLSIPAKNVVRHYDCHTGHKLCPAYYSGQGKAKRWKELHDYITA